MVRGIVVHSRSIVGTIGAGLQSLFGGNITLYTQAVRGAHRLTMEHAAHLGANVIIGVRYDATELTGGVTEVLGLQHRRLHLDSPSLVTHPRTK